MGTQVGSRRSATAAWHAPTPARAGRGRLHGSTAANNVWGAWSPPGAGETHHFSCGAMLLNMILIIVASCAALA